MTSGITLRALGAIMRLFKSIRIEYYTKDGLEALGEDAAFLEVRLLLKL